MNSVFRLNIDKHSFSAENLLQSSWSIKDEYTLKVIAHAKDWLSGQAYYTFNTSGSTGEPKAIQHSREAIITSIEATAQALSIKEGDSALLCLHVDMTGGRMMLYRALHLGLRLTVVPPSGNPFAQCAESFDFLSFVPLQLQQLIEDDSQLQRLNAAHSIIVGGAAVSPALLMSIQKITAPVYSTYGMTETISHIALQRLNGTKKEDMYVALPGVQLSLDERGCLRIVTSHATVTTNDLATIQDNTHFTIQGRADQIINSGGFKINPFKVETSLEATLKSEGVEEYFLAGLPDDTLGQMLVLFILGAHKDTASIMERLKVAIPTGYFRPKKIISLETFIYTPSGKTDRLKIVQQYLNSHA